MYSVYKAKVPDFDPTDEEEIKAFIEPRYGPGYYTVYEIGKQKVEYFYKGWIGVEVDQDEHDKYCRK